jgi:kynurenine formamidase
MKYYDLSHPITEQPACSFSVIDTIPKVRFMEGESHGVFFITSKIDNLFSNFCTHIDFPGHISELGSRYYDSIGRYPIERFTGQTVCLDFSHKLNTIREFFDARGYLKIDFNSGEMVKAFLDSLNILEITTVELNDALKKINSNLEGIKGLLIYTGLSKFWKYEINDSWNFIYFFGPFLSAECCDLLISKDISFMGVDALQVEHPIINFRGDEKPIILNPDCRQHVTQKLDDLEKNMVHKKLLGNDILIYENLNIPPELVNSIFTFSGVPLNIQLSGVNDNALARPYGYIV